MTAITPTDEQAVAAMRTSLVDWPRPVFDAGHQGREPFAEHVLLSARFLQAAILNKHQSDGSNDGAAWRRYFKEHVSRPEAEANAQLLWDEWRTSLIKDDTPGVGIVITHCAPDSHWTTDAEQRLCLDLESMWADYDASVDHFMESLRPDRARFKIVLKRWQERAWRVVPFTPTSDAQAETTVSAAARAELRWRHAARGVTAHGPEPK